MSTQWTPLTDGWPQHWVPLWITDGDTVHHGQWCYGFRGPGKERYTYWYDIDSKYELFGITHWMLCIPPDPPKEAQ